MYTKVFSGINEYAITEIVFSAFMGRVKHPYIVGAEKIEYKNDELKITSQKGESLFGTNLDEEEIIILAAQIIYAVEFLYLCGISHSDIKPSNIIKMKKGHYALIDFDHSHMGTVCEYTKTTYSVAAPELFDTKLVYTNSHQADIWSLGATLLIFLDSNLNDKLYYLCNVSDFNDISRENKEKMIESIHKSYLSIKDVKLREFIGSMLAVDPWSRPTIIELVNNNFIKESGCKRPELPDAEFPVVFSLPRYGEMVPRCFWEGRRYFHQIITKYISIKKPQLEAAIEELDMICFTYFQRSNESQKEKACIIFLAAFYIIVCVRTMEIDYSIQKIASMLKIHLAELNCLAMSILEVLEWSYPLHYPAFF